MTHPLTNALAMRTAAAETASRFEQDVIADWILELPLEADHAALLAEAVRLPEIAALIRALRGTLPALAENGDYPNMPHFNAYAALQPFLALETP